MADLWEGALIGDVHRIVNACFHAGKLHEGQVISEGVALEPVEVQFADRYTKCRVEVAVDNDRHYLKEAQYVDV